MTITPAQFADYFKKVHAHLDWAPPRPHRVFFLALALCGETGELANLLKKDWRSDAGDRQEKIKKELADVAGYAFLLAAELGIDLLSETYAKVQEAEEKPEFKAYQARKS